MKICSKCKANKEYELYHKDITSKDGYNSICKECKSVYNKINKDSISKRHKEYYEQNKEKHLKTNRNNYFSSQEKHIQYHRNHYQQNKEKHKQLCKQWREKKYPKKTLSEDELKLKYNRRQIETKLRSWVKEAIKKNLKKSKSSLILGCSIEHCRNHIQSQFTPEMTWNNYGKVWEIDHIIGCCNFDLFKLEEQQKCFHYTNLQPLFKTTKVAELFGYVGYIGNKNKTKYN